MTSEERAQSFRGKTRGGVAKCRLFSKANISHELTICVCCQRDDESSAIWKCELSIEKLFVRELTECYMLRPFAHPVAYCVLLGVVAQSLKPVKLSKLLAPCKRRNIVGQRCWELLRLFERSLRFLSPQSLNFSNPQSLQYSITSEPPIEDVLHVFHQCPLLNVLKETISAKSK